MFGYVVANGDQLTPEQFARYKGCYCGLCHTLQEQYGLASRLSLTYDMTFLVLLLSSLYEPDESAADRACVLHPMKPRPCWTSPVTGYAAAMNVALAYYNCMDDWQDDRNLLRRGQAQLFLRAMKKIRAQYPEKCAWIAERLARLTAVEQSGAAGPDAGANEFGNLMAELFVLKEDRWAAPLRAFGESLGKFIYLMDAVCDLEDDRRRGRYNPLLALGAKEPQAYKAHLTLLIGDAVQAFERLPLVQDEDILRNILYSGVWSRYALMLQKKEPTHD